MPKTVLNVRGFRRHDYAFHKNNRRNTYERCFVPGPGDPAKGLYSLDKFREELKDILNSPNIGSMMKLDLVLLTPEEYAAEEKAIAAQAKAEQDAKTERERVAGELEARAKALEAKAEAVRDCAVNPAEVDPTKPTEPAPPPVPSALEALTKKVGKRKAKEE